MALVLNLAFVGVVIAGFAFLYTGGFGGGTGAPAAPTAEPQIERDAEDGPEFRLATARDGGVSLPGDSLSSAGIQTSALEPASAAQAGVQAGALDQPNAAGVSPSGGIGGPDLEIQGDDLAVDENGETITLAAIEAAPPTVPEPDAAETVVDAGVEVAVTAGVQEVADLGPTPRLAPRLATTDADAVLSTLDPAASLWSAAGSLAANLQRDFPCSQFSLQADGSGRPLLRARVGFSDDIDLVRARVDENFGDLSDIEGGMGCTTVVGGGYVALSDDNGQVALFDSSGLSREIRAVLPGEGTCAVLGQVVATQPNLLQRLASAGKEATWVRSGGEPALCEIGEDGMWQVVSGRNAGARRAAALVVGDDVLATDARSAANLAAPAPEEEEEQAYALDLSSAASDLPPVASRSASTGDAAEVAPIEGPTPLLPAGVVVPVDGYAVTVGFTVDEEGKAQDVSVTGAGMAGVSVVAAALDVVNASRFPAAAEPYQGSYTVRFASAEFQDLLTRLSLATATDRDAEPVWDRSPTQQDYDRHFPDRALRRGISGEVQVDCTIAFDGRLTCSVARETPGSWGFGGAALELAELMRAGPRMTDGGPSANETVQLDFVFSSGGLQ